jgi:uncharacterized membrane protein YphA (DoxX/SURF4 family)
MTSPLHNGRLLGLTLWCGLVGGMLCSPNLWRTRESLPNLPVWDWLPVLPTPWDIILLVASLVAIMVGVLSSQRRLVGVVGWSGLLAVALADQLRWQPWAYQYWLGLGIVLLGGDRFWQRLLMAAVYFWSGIYKLGPGYQNLHLEIFVQPLGGQGMLLGLGKAAPWLEMGCGIALFLPYVRRAAVVVLAVMHLGILVALGYVAKFPNTVVWPWNICMLLLLAQLFWKKENRSAEAFWHARSVAFAGISLLLLLVGPLLAFQENWDRYLSFQLYSGRERRGLMILDQSVHASLPRALQAACQASPSGPGMHELRFFEWCMRELNAPPPAEPRILLALARHVAAQAEATRGELLFYSDFHFLRKEMGWDIWPPDQFQRMTRIPQLKKQFR